MQQLVKPSEYAKMYGISRQSVYAKIKRGTLPSRKVDGRYYVIVSDDIVNEADEEVESQESPQDEIEHVSLIDEYREIIRAKDETIDVLKASIEDLKEANAQITQTLQQEITLLKQAFHEMRAIYQRDYMITHSSKIDEAHEEVVEADFTTYQETELSVQAEAAESEGPRVKMSKKKKKDKKSEEEECWIPLGDLIQRNAFNYNKAKQVVKRFKKAYKKGDPRIRKQNGIYYISCYDFYDDILD